MNRFTVTLTWTYDVDDASLRKYYDTDDPDAAAAIDTKNYNDYPYFAGEEINEGHTANFKAVVKAEKL